jgi:hypothetical protein
MSCNCGCNSDQTINTFTGSKGATGETGATGATGADGEAGADGADGADGLNGWTAETANVADGDRIVQQVVDWFGGTGDKPSTTDVYVGAAGFVNTAAAATDIRGPEGEAGADGAAGVDATDGRSKISSNDTTLGYLKDKLISSDSTVAFTEVNDAGDEDLSISTKSILNNEKKITADTLTTSYEDIIYYTTPNDGFTRKYIINFSCIGYILESDGSGRVARIEVELYVDGAPVDSIYIDTISLSGYAKSHRQLIIDYPIDIPPNKIILIKAKKSNENFTHTVNLIQQKLSIFGIL